MIATRLRTALAALLGILVLTACSSKPTPPAPDAATLLRNLPAADIVKFPNLHDTKSWRNPYIVIRADRVGLLTGVAADEEQILKPEEVLDALARLPASAWPYGRAVAILVSDSPGSSDEDKTELRRKRALVAGALEGAHVAIQWVPAQ